MGMTNKEELELMSYLPEMWLMRKDNIYAAQKAIRIGLENIEAKIVELETLPRICRANKNYLEFLRNEKLFCEEALEGLNKPE
jgi:hypothetical protein